LIADVVDACGIHGGVGTLGIAGWPAAMCSVGTGVDVAWCAVTCVCRVSKAILS
jgi:hypothetical protein